MGAVIDVGRVVIKIPDFGIGQLLDQITLELVLNKAAQLQSVGGPFVDYFLFAAEAFQTRLHALFEGHPVHAALVSRQSAAARRLCASRPLPGVSDLPARRALDDLQKEREDAFGTLRRQTGSNRRMDHQRTGAAQLYSGPTRA